MADWDARYNAPEYIFGKEPSGFLAEHANLLPAKGRALALAEGEGRNAVFLAKHGLKVDACDLSAPAIKKLKRLASDEHVTVNAFVADLETYEIAQASYHVIICFHYFDRALIPRIIGGLHVGGLAIMEVFTVDNIRRGFRGPTEKKFCAEKNELAQLFTGLEILEYREGIVENRKAVASIIARKNRSDESPG
ncbi:MAG: class I SAM-dependent methyltransferase [Terriglobia bacterium]